MAVNLPHQDYDAAYCTDRYSNGDSIQAVTSDLERRICFLEEMLVKAHEDNPALQDAYERYMTVWKLTK